MPDRVKFASLCILVVLVVFMVAPIAKADGWDKETIVTFSNPVEVPGQVLPRGTYVFKLADSQSDRHIVQIFTADHRKLLATILAIPDYRLTPTEKTMVSFEERPSGSPEAVGSWFYPGDNHGFKFVYPRSTTQLAADPQPAIPAAAPAAPPVEATAPATPPSEREALVGTPQEEVQIVAQATPVQPVQSVPASLPKTAGNFMALPLVGFGLLAGGSIILHKVRQRT